MVHNRGSATPAHSGGQWMPGEAMATTVVDAFSMVQNGSLSAFPREPLYTDEIYINIYGSAEGPWAP